MSRTTLEERLKTPEFAEGVKRHRAKLEAEEAGWVVMEPKRARALLAVVSAAGQANCDCGKGQDPAWTSHMNGCRLGRVLARLYRLSSPPSRRGSLRKGSTVEGNDTLPANSRRTARAQKRSR